MSAEHFETVLSCDIRTAPDGRGVEYTRSGEGHPRWLTEDGLINRPKGGERTWANCYIYAHNAVDVAARAVAHTPLDGISGDLPNHRQQAANILVAASALVRYLACDAAHDGAVTAEGYERLLREVRNAADEAAT